MISLQKVKKLLAKKKASIIFNMKYNTKNPNLDSNFIFTLRWFLKNYPKKDFEYILIEQDTEEKIKIPEDIPIKRRFIYNPSIFNRGWGYNVAVKYFMNTDVAVFCDSDIILEYPESLIKSIEICQKEKKIVSPYSHVAFTTVEERQKILEKDMEDISYESRHPVTISGGIVTVNKEAFLEVGGFEEYKIYGGEDRSLDVIFMSENKAEMIDGFGIHLYHPKNPTIIKNESKLMLDHLLKTFSCSYDRTLKPYDFIHSNCNHKTLEELEEHIKLKLKYFANIDLYKTSNKTQINSFPI